MSRAGVLLAGLLVIASIGVMAQGTTSLATTPVRTNAQATAASPAQPNAVPAAQNKVPQTPPATPSSGPQTGPSSAASNDLAANQQLPQTSTILPLLGLIGLGSLVAGLFARR